MHQSQSLLINTIHTPIVWHSTYWLVELVIDPHGFVTCLNWRHSLSPFIYRIGFNWFLSFVDAASVQLINLDTVSYLRHRRGFDHGCGKPARRRWWRNPRPRIGRPSTTAKDAFPDGFVAATTTHFYMKEIAVYYYKSHWLPHLFKHTNKNLYWGGRGSKKKLFQQNIKNHQIRPDN